MTDDELHALVSRIDSNCFGVYKSGCGDVSDGRRPRLALGRNVDLLGRGLYLEAALFNHSCSPNVTHRWDPAQRVRVVFASRDIAEGEELLVVVHLVTVLIGEDLGHADADNVRNDRQNDGALKQLEYEA